MRRTDKLRAYPTRPQEGRSAQLKEIRAADPAGQGRHSFTAQQQSHASFQAVGRVKVSQHRPVAGRVKTLQLKRAGRRWYVIVVTDIEPVPLPPTGRSAGVDLGAARFLTTSDGGIIANPRFLDAAQVRLADLQRRKQHAGPGSGNIATRAALGSGQAPAAREAAG